MSALLVASLGTDHHPFQRLVDWFDALAVRFPDLEVVVQHGHTPPPVVAAGHDFLPHAELLDLMRGAAVVVSHAGPGTIMDARRAGHRPVVVPRDPTLGEHVDGHQLRFARTLAEADSASVATTRIRLEELIRQTLAGTLLPEHPETDARNHRAAVRSLVAELDTLPREAPRLPPIVRSLRRVIHR